MARAAVSGVECSTSVFSREEFALPALPKVDDHTWLASIPLNQTNPGRENDLLWIMKHCLLFTEHQLGSPGGRRPLPRNKEQVVHVFADSKDQPSQSI